MMDGSELLRILKETGAYLNGHFLLTSGLHSDAYVEKFRVLERPEYTEAACRELAGRFGDQGVAVVVGPTMGGVILAYEVARALGARAIFVEREGSGRTLRRGFSIAKGERTLVVEDVVTTGGSVREVIQVVQDAGGDLVGVGLLIDRSAGGADFGVRTESLLRLPLVTYRPEECPLCRDGIPLVRPGSVVRQHES
ncbi:MAG: orotate phosphoribosyltransferase [Firmicutes bacterium]|nr:orotate phosphoribosyltransferase [Bacillota bacterium]